MKVEPVSVEVTLESGLTMRGYEWPARGAPVVLLHDYDHDLDAWQEIDRELAQKSFRVINLELRGHGFSDGEPDRDLLFSDAEELLKELGTVWGPLGLCTYGRVSASLCSLGGTFLPKVHIAISPLLDSITKGIKKATKGKSRAIPGQTSQFLVNPSLFLAFCGPCNAGEAHCRNPWRSAWHRTRPEGSRRWRTRKAGRSPRRR